MYTMKMGSLDRGHKSDKDVLHAKYDIDQLAYNFSI